ncbi:isovaleryl-CoA dehydrogenase [Pseudokordiimonas caeni]|uniref:isovaleryl-CoA dehydrogenase n=1 Tax=Pseudokordiimonas caeni TaxID=2997908 RepID=UPI002811D0A4|nr:isovaleryl-CoA dehydrogenase [Pseudokordiimonas caeni]
MALGSAFETHEVFNQAPLYDGVNLYTSDAALMAAVKAEDADWADDRLTAFGAELGRAELFDEGERANRFLPELKVHDSRGYRQDMVEFHPSYHRFMSISKREHIHCGAFDGLATDARPKAPGVGVARAARHYMMSQVEAGHICPITMTHAAIPAIAQEPSLAATWLPKILSPSYDPALKPMAEKSGATIGMGMTEKQGGTDVRANTSVARPSGARGPGEPYLVTGHKWFMSAPMCDAFLVLAQAEGGLSVFLMPRFRADGSLNGLRFQRLKNKLGNKSNASSEVEFHDAEAYLIGEEGRGIRNIMTMAHYTRLDCALGSAGLMRQAFSRAIHHAVHRQVFQKRLVDQPMMTGVLADLALEVDAATHLALRLAGAFERHDNDAEQAFARLMTPVAKYWITKRGPSLGYEAMECLGGNGYLEDGINARIYRELPVNSIWEGTGSVMCLDVFRVMTREPDAVAATLVVLEAAAGRDRHYDALLDSLKDRIASHSLGERDGRWLTESLALLAAAAILMDRAPAPVAEGYLANRLAPRATPASFGVLAAGTDARAILEASVPTFLS